MIGLGIGGSSDKAMLLAKEALLEPIDMSDLQARGPSTPEEEMRLELYEKINALGIGAQGLGGLTTVVDVRLKPSQHMPRRSRSGSCRSVRRTGTSSSSWMEVAQRSLIHPTSVTGPRLRSTGRPTLRAE